MPLYVWIIIVIVVIALIALAMTMANKKRQEQHREQADEIRGEASSRAAGLTGSQRDADKARAQAEQARIEAQQAEERAGQAEQGHQMEQAQVEDQTRTADRIDPDVDDRSDGYEPGTWRDEGTADGSSRDGVATESDGSSTEPRRSDT